MLIAEYRTDGPLLKEALKSSPEMVIQHEEQYNSEQTAHLIFWAKGGDFTGFEESLTADPTITDHQLLTETQTRRLYRVTITEQAQETNLLPAMRDLNLVLLEAETTHKGWTIRIRFPDRETLAEYREIHRARDFPFQVQSIYHESEAEGEVEALLTDAQREALVTAYEAGYFDVPQRSSQSDVAARLNIAPQSLSERLKRGFSTLIDATLISP